MKPPRIDSPLLAACALALALCALPAGLRAELYEWVDADGRVRFTDDLTRVPPEQRAEARRDPPAPQGEGGAWNTVTIRPRVRLETRAPAAPSHAPQTGTRHVLSVQRGANEIRLVATLDESVDAHFVADTGASMNTLPAQVADRLGLQIGSDTPRISVIGVGGQPIRAPLVRLDSIRVGSAVVRDVEAVVLDTIDTGLLGMPFFNHFKVEIDPAAGTLALTEISLDGVEGVHGGADEGTWRQRYRQIRERREAIAQKRAEVPSEFETVAESYLERLDEAERQLDEQLEQLDAAAARAGVPGAWRE